MAVTLTINGTGYTFPETGEEGWGAAVTNWASAVTSGMLQKAGGTFTLTAEVDFGGSFGLKALYYKSRGTVPSTGVVRLANAETIAWRNAANDGNVLVTVNSSDNFTVAGSAALLGGSNLGGGEGVFKDVSGSTARFKSLVEGSNITLTSDGNEITIAAAAVSVEPSGFYGITVGQTDDNPAYKNINTVKFNTDDFYISQQDTDTAIVNFRGTSGGGGSGEANTASNLGAGEGVFSSKSGVDLRFKSLIGGTNITLSSDSNEITIVNDGITVAESKTGGPSTVDDTLVFNSDDFYISSAGNDANPLINLTFPRSIAEKVGPQVYIPSLPGGVPSGGFYLLTTVAESLPYDFQVNAIYGRTNSGEATLNVEDDDVRVGPLSEFYIATDQRSRTGLSTLIHEGSRIRYRITDHEGAAGLSIQLVGKKVG